ncbi:MAG: hypothetical protein ACLTBV_31755 [Enterocloster bolteae]
MQTEFPLIFKDIEERKFQEEYVNDRTILNSDLKDTSFIYELDNNHVVVWVPIELLFSEKKEDITNFSEYTEGWKQQNSQFENIPIISLNHTEILLVFYAGYRVSIYILRVVPETIYIKGDEVRLYR